MKKTAVSFAAGLSGLLFAAAALAGDDHLLLTEAVVTPTAAEFVEIFNPTGAPIALDDVYLSDDADYALLPGASGAGPAPSISSSDFIVRFPPGSSLGAGAVAVVAMDGLAYEATYGSKADYELKGTDGATPDMIATNLGAGAGLTNSGEALVLFSWDGSSDLVADLDMVQIGTPSASNMLADKSGLMVDGPDGDSSASAYAAEAASIPSQAGDPGPGVSTKRIRFESGFEAAGGNGLTGDDESSEDTSVTWDSLFSIPDPGVFNVGSVLPDVVINEVDSDTAGTDTLEFVELTGPAGTSLDGLVLVLYNGSDDASYAAYDLDGYSIGLGGFFVVGNAGVANVDLVIAGNSLQNGADAVALHLGDGADFPNDTPVTDVDLIDALVYDTSDADDSGLLNVLTPGQAQINENGGGDKDNHSNSRLPDGGTALDTSTYVQQAPTPGASNGGGPTPVINEVDADTPGTDVAEFIELLGEPNASLDGLVLVLHNGSDDASSAAFDLDGYSLDGDGFFVLGNAGVTNVDLVVPSNTIQNGADAVALYIGDAADFPVDTPVDNIGLLDAVVYDTNDADDAGLLSVLTPGQPQINEDGAGDKDNHAIARVPDGGLPFDTSTYVPQMPTPGASNIIVDTDIVINEVDADTPGTDMAEFVELFGTPNSPLDGLVVVFYNGNGDTSYAAYDLDGFSTDGGGFFLMGNAAIPGADIILSSNAVQNGADAIAIYAGNAADFPNGTAVTASGLIDALVYDTNDSDDAGLLSVLLPGQAQINEDGMGDKDNHSNSRLPDGGSALDTSSYVQKAPTPGFSNVPVPEIVINEVDADTPGTDMAEFLELFGAPNEPLDGLVVVTFNGSSDTSYGAYDLDGYSLDNDGFFVIGNAGVDNVGLVFPGNSLQNGADAVALYVGSDTDFPNGTAVTENKLIDALVYDTDDADDAGLLVLLNAGQPQVNERGGGDGTGHANARVPDGGIARNSDTYVQQAPTPGAPNFVEPPVTIAEIQGAGTDSPLVGLNKRTEGNIVTAVAANGFYIQTPDADVDGDPMTSEGLFVFTGGAPALSVGDEVEVEGDIVEFFGFTEMSGNVSFTVTSSGNPLPSAALLDGSLPSPVPRPTPDLEPLEGMLVEVIGGVAGGPTNRFGNIPLVAVGGRPFREPGILFPGLPGLPVWDGNPEIFEVNPDGAGLPNVDVFAGATIDTVGALGFSFGAYQIQPTSLDVTPPNLTLDGVRDRNIGEITVACQNMFRLFDGLPDAGGYADRLTKFSLWIREVMDAPDILAVSEVGTIEVLEDLAARILNDDPAVNYSVYLIEGNDIGGIDSGFMVRDSINVSSVSQIQANDTFTYEGTVFILHDRPPLLLEGSLDSGGLSYPINVMAVHNRSLSSIATSGRVRAKRWEQADRIASAIRDMQMMDPDLHLVVCGDFNAFEFTDGYVDSLGIITGILDPLGALLPGTDYDPDLTNQVLSVPASERYSFVFAGSAQSLDHILTTASLDNYVVEMQYARGNADAPGGLGSDVTTPFRSADHDGLVLYLALPTLPDIIARLQAVIAANPGKCTDKVEDALAGADTALDEMLKPDQEAALGNLEGVEGDLEAAYDEEECNDPSELVSLMDDIAAIARYVVVTAVEEASGNTGDAEDSLAEGDDYRAEGKYKDAVAKYKDALSKL
ncbi:MAG: hypothetical protein QNK37_04125 [Acidobacteriota bacterium]|nr:hypothetical protein [Acidobacteriota bacterium]